MNSRFIPLAYGFLLALCGCQTNPYTQYYTNVIPPQETAKLLPYSGHTDFMSVPLNDWKAGVDKLMSMGYAYLGYANFEGRAKDYEPKIRERAKELGADIVLVTSAFARTVSGVMPLLNYQPGQVATTYSSGQVNANAFNNQGTYTHGTANYSGQSTTTTPGTFSTNYVPYSVDRYSYGAGFFRKRSWVFGARCVPLDTNQRQKLQRNIGVVVAMVVDGSPAFLANILPGDILLTIDGEQITTGENFLAQIDARTGRKVSVGMLRNDKEMMIELELGRSQVATPAPSK